MIVSVIGGTGPQGLGIALRLAIEGVEVIVGSRKEEKALDVVAEAKEKYADYDLNIKGLANEDAAKEGDILILTVPPLETAIGGKPFRFVDLMEGSAAERTASILKGTGAKVICAFCNISNSHLSNIPEEIDCDCLIAGDDKEAKEIAAELINKIPGIRTIDTGILEKSRIIEKITPLLIGLNIKYKSHYGGLRITGIPKLDE